MKRTRFIWFVIIGLMAALALTGCQAQRKPAPGGQTTPAPTTPAPSAPAPTLNKPTALPTNPTEMNKLSESLAREAARVKGVNKATVVLTGNTAMVGLDLKAGADAKKVKSEVADAVKRSNNLIKNVLVSTDPELNTRLVNISKGIAQGKPIDTFTREIDQLRNRLSPSTR